jgi:hypothetical protein
MYLVVSSLRVRQVCGWSTLEFQEASEQVEMLEAGDRVRGSMESGGSYSRVESEVCVSWNRSFHPMSFPVGEGMEF